MDVLVDVSDGAVGPVGERICLAGLDVVTDEFRDVDRGDRRHGVEVEYPAQRYLGHRQVLGDVRFQFVDRVEAALEGEAGERLAAVERLAFAVEVAVVVFREFRVPGIVPVGSPEIRETPTMTP